MIISVTEFRKNLFQVLQKALEGEPVELTYFDQRIRLVPDTKPSISARLTKRDTLNIPPEELPEAISKMRAEWK